MKQNNSRSLVTSSLLIALCATIFSFSTAKNGGDSFEIYLNGKLVLQQALYNNKEVKSLQLTQSSENDKVDIYYSHCGQTGKNRTITIKDGQNRLLKEWHFADATGKNAMSFKLKDILSLQNKNDNRLNLYYSSKELPDGRLLASINAVKGQVTKP